jgi:hypothetical protein
MGRIMFICVCQKCVCAALLLWKFCMHAWKTHLHRISRMMLNYNNFHAQTESVAGPKKFQTARNRKTLRARILGVWYPVNGWVVKTQGRDNFFPRQLSISYILELYSEIIHSNPALCTIRYTYFWFTYYFFRCIIHNMYKDFDIRTSLNILYFIWRTLLNVRTSINVLYFILHTLLNVLCQWRNKAKECIVTSICPSIWPSICVPCHLFSWFSYLTKPPTHSARSGSSWDSILSLSFRILWERSSTNYTLITCKSTQIPISI